MTACIYAVILYSKHSTSIISGRKPFYFNSKNSQNVDAFTFTKKEQRGSGTEEKPPAVKEVS